MLLGKRPRPPVMRRTRSMSGGLATDMQTTDEHNQTNNLEPHHEEQQQSVMSNHNPLPLLPQPHDDDQHALVTMETEESHRESTVMYHHDQGRIQTSHTSVAKRERNHDEGLVENTVMMFPSYTTTITNNGSTIINHNIPLSVSAPVIHSTPHFLRICGLCNCPLAPGRDIYMYRGDTAFCSLECREEQMKQDRRIEKWKMTASNNEEHRVAPPCTATAKASTAACT